MRSSKTDHSSGHPELVFAERQAKAAEKLNWITVGSAMVALLGLVVIGWTLWITRSQLHLSQRPWIEAVSIGEWKAADVQQTRYSQHVQFYWDFKIKNVGAGVAIREETVPGTISDDLNKVCPTGKPSDLNKFCDLALDLTRNNRPPLKLGDITWSSPQFGDVIFPQQEYTTVAAQTQFDLHAPGSPTRPLLVYASGCSVYLDQFKILHHTKFCLYAFFDGKSLSNSNACNMCNDAD